MQENTSKLAAVRQHGTTQVDGQRANILDAAEHCFLRIGLEHTTMADIAEQAGITRMTLYRYFPDRDTIAFEIAVRMFQRITSLTPPAPVDEPAGDVQHLEHFKHTVQAMIRNFPALRDTYRYLGMFDHLYTDRYPTEELATWYKQYMQRMLADRFPAGSSTGEVPYVAHVLMALNTSISFLQRMATRGELMASEHGVPLDAQLHLFDVMISSYVDQLVVSLPWPNQPPNK